MYLYGNKFGKKHSYSLSYPYGLYLILEVKDIRYLIFENLNA